MKLTILGTSSAVPLPNRNLSGTLLQYEGEYLLFDCGEGTQFHLKKLSVATGKLRVICLTHLHGDHTFGLLGLMSGLTFGDKNKTLVIIGPRGIKEIIDVSLKNQQFYFEYPLEVIELDFLSVPKTVYETRDYFISVVSLDHRIPSFGYRFEEKQRSGHVDLEKAEKLKVPIGPKLGELKAGKSVISDDGKIVRPEMIIGEPINGKSFCYITDTRFCERSILLAQSCDVLMHESTYAEELLDKAKETGHSTAKQAATVAFKSNAGKLILFHYSSRYMKTDILLNEAKQIFENTVAGKDFEEYWIKESR